MKRNVLYNMLLLPLAVLIAMHSMAQSLAPDQNPDYMISQAKYVQMADSLNELHGTTPQETYKAIDWMADRQARRDERRAFRRQLRMERARYGWYYNGYDSYYPTYSYYPSYSGNYWYNYHPYHNSNYYHSRWNNWNLVPLAATAATIGWLLTR